LWWFKVSEDLFSLHNFKHEIPSETHLIPFAETNEQKSLVLREEGHIEADTRNFVPLNLGIFVVIIFMLILVTFFSQIQRLIKQH